MNQPEDISVSAQTLQKMQEELDYLTGTGRDEMAVRLLRARELGDLKENAEYHSAKDAQGMMEARIRILQNTIKNSVVQQIAAGDLVAPGVVVTVKDSYGTEDYLFAQSMEEKTPGMTTVTQSSPMGKALVGKRVGETAEVEAPRGSFTVEVAGIRPV